MKKVDLSEFGFRKDFDPDNRFHLLTTVKYNGKKFKVSTVDLGLDHSFGFGPPLYYETMIFNDYQSYEYENPFEGFQERYSTEKEAIKRHKEIINMFKSKKVDELLNDR